MATWTMHVGWWDCACGVNGNTNCVERIRTQDPAAFDRFYRCESAMCDTNWSTHRGVNGNMDRVEGTRMQHPAAYESGF